MNGIVARNEALEWGVFRGEGEQTNTTADVNLGKHGRYTPLATQSGAPELNRVFSEGVAALAECEPFERGMAFFLFGSLQQFLFDGNKRSSRLMINGLLMDYGIDAMSVPAASSREFNEKMARFCCSKDGTEMMASLIVCHPDGQKAPST